jgi:type IV pilus assembly protein PilW
VRPARPAPRAPQGQRGMSLVEVMVSMVIGLFIVLIATTIYVESIRNFGFRIGQSENLGNSRYTLGTLGTLGGGFAHVGYRRDPTQPLDQAFPADASAHPNGCAFKAGQAIYVVDTKNLCLRYQARDNLDKDCAGSAAGIPALVAYEAPPAPAVGAGMFVERYFLKDGTLVCQAGASATETQVADGVRDVLFQFGVGQVADTGGERRLEQFKTTTPAAEEALRSLRYAILLSSVSGGLTGGMESTVCTRWVAMGGASASCDTSKGQLYQLATGSLTLRNLMP